MAFLLNKREKKCPRGGSVCHLMPRILFPSSKKKGSMLLNLNKETEGNWL